MGWKLITLPIISLTGLVWVTPNIRRILNKVTKTKLLGINMYYTKKELHGIEVSR